MRPVTLRCRTAEEPDLDRLVDIHMAAYPDDRDAAARKRNFTANVFGELDDVVVVEDRGDIVGHGRLFPMASWFGGRKVRVGGIASVAVAPEARGRGVATALLEELHARARSRGDAVTLLYAFKQGFYARLGYGPTSTRRRLAVSPEAIPASFRDAARALVGRARGEDREAIEKAYLRSAARCTGWLLRRPRHWERLFARERRQVLVARRGKKLVGYVGFEIEQPEAHAETRLVVEELVADDAEVRRALWGALSAMRDQVAEIDVEVAADDPIAFALLDADRRRHGTEAVEHVMGEIVVGPMVRLVDPARALTARGYAGPAASFDVALAEGPRLGVVVADGKAELVKAKGRAVVHTSTATLASLLYGGLRLEGAVSLGLADAPPEVVARVAPALALAPMFPVDPF